MARNENQLPGCASCIHKEDCEYNTDRADTYCQRYQSKEPPDRGPDPAEMWSRGEEIWQ